MRILFIIFFCFSSFNSFSHHPGHKFEATSPYPSVHLKIIKDSIDGYNLFIDLKNFKLDPTSVGQDNQTNTGHLHLYVNDIKIARVYSQWHHIPQRFFNLRENIVKVSLNSNLHDAFTIEGEPIQVILKVINN